MSGWNPVPRTEETLEARRRAIRSVNLRTFSAAVTRGSDPRPLHTIGHALERAAAENA